MNRGRPTTRPSDRYPGWGISATDCIELSLVEPGSARARALLDQIERQLKECRTIDAIAGVGIVRQLVASSAQRRGTRPKADRSEPSAPRSTRREPSAVGTGVTTSDPPPVSSSIGVPRP